MWLIEVHSFINNRHGESTIAMAAERDEVIAVDWRVYLQGSYLMYSLTNKMDILQEWFARDRIQPRVCSTKWTRRCRGYLLVDWSAKTIKTSASL